MKKTKNLRWDLRVRSEVKMIREAVRGGKKKGWDLKVISIVWERGREKQKVER